MLRALRNMILLASFCPVWFAFTQAPHGNEWIQAGIQSPWTKMWVSNNGVHRVYYYDLLSQHDLYSSLSHTGLKVFHRGQEIPIYVKPSLTGWEYIEFIGKINDGGDDKSLYESPATFPQANPLISLFTDQAAYYLSWSKVPGKRYVTFNDPVYTGKQSLPYVYISQEAEPDYSTYVAGGGGPFSTTYSLNSQYVTGEGYHIGSFVRKKPLEITLNLSGIYPLSEEDLYLEFGTFGASQTPHILRVESIFPDSIRILDTLWQQHDIYHTTFTKKIKEQTSLSHTYRFEAFNQPNDEQSLRWFKVHYPRLLSIGDVGRIPISRWDHDTASYLEIQNFGPSQEIHAFLDQEPVMAVGSVQGNVGRINLPGTPNTQAVWLAGSHGVYRPILTEPDFTSLCAEERAADVLIITHPSLESSAASYQHYREQQGYSTLLATTNEIYDEFGYGSRTPQAIKRFCACVNATWESPPTHLILWGKAYQEGRDHPMDKVPTYGFPASDWLYVMEDNATPPFMGVGRVPISNNQEGLVYLDKIQAYESQEENDRMKKGLLLGGGISDQERTQIGEALDRYATYFTPDPWDARPYFLRSGTAASDTSYHQTISEGLGWIHFMGHPLQNAEDIALYNASAYTNTAHFPFILAMGDEGGNFTSNTSFGEEWIFEARKGAIAYLGSSGAGFLTQQETYANHLYENLFFQQNGESIGIILQETVKSMLQSNSILSYRNQAVQFNLLGDPLLTLPVAPEITTDVLPQEEELYYTHVFPNPAKDQFTLTYQLPNGAKELHLRLINMVGQEVSRITISGNKGDIILPLPTSSNYLVRKGKLIPSGQTYYLDVLIKNL